MTPAVRWRCGILGAMPAPPAPARLIGLDWGTSSLRAYLFDGRGHVLAQRRTAQGILSVAAGGFRDTFHAICHGWLDDATLPVIACGMVGSRQGWQEAPYAAAPAGFAALSRQLLRIDAAAGRPFAIVPGVSLLRADGTHDVMRGEETQVFGALDADAARAPAQATDWVLPGTHSKWVQVRADEIVAFRTYLTGELYAVLSEHSILGRLFARGAGPDAADPSDAFRDGVARAAADPAGLSALLFSVRAEGLFGRYDAQALPDYLSGLLIGAEIAHARPVRAGGQDGGAVRVIGTDGLAVRYRAALAALGLAACDTVAEPAAAGLFRIAQTAGLMHEDGPSPLPKGQADG